MNKDCRLFRNSIASLFGCVCSLSIVSAAYASGSDSHESPAQNENSPSEQEHFINKDALEHDRERKEELRESKEDEREKQAEEKAKAEKQALKDLPNFRALHSYLYCGGKPSEAGLWKLKSMGVTTVINLRKTKRSVEAEKLACNHIGLSYLTLPIAHDGPTSAQVDSFLKEVRTAKAAYNPETKKSSHAVYVHCSFGEDRTGCLIGIYRMVEDGWSQRDALEEMHKYGFSLHRRGLWDVFDSYSVKDTAK